MRMRRGHLLFVALTLSAPSATHSASADEPSAAYVQDLSDRKLRGELGFRTDEQSIRALRERKQQGHNVHDTLVGIPLSDEEYAELLVRDELGRVDAATTRDLFRTRNDFGGLYIDNRGGGRLQVLTTGEVGTVDALLRPRLRHPDRLAVTQVRWTYQDLTSAQKSVEAHLPELQARGVAVSTIAVDEMSNAVQVALVDNTTENRSAVRAATSAGLPLTFVRSARLVLAGGNVQNSLPFRGGQSIRDGSHAAPSFDCSIGFIGYQTVSSTTREPAVITAGHCGVSGQPWYQYNEYMGLSTVNTWPKNGGATIADAMRIPVNRGLSNDVLGANYNVFNISGWEGQYDGAVGQTVCNNGATSYRVCGVLQLNNVTVMSQDPDTGQLVTNYYMRETTADVQGGDSGGSVTHTAGLHYASGIVHGGFPVEEGSADLERMVYVHMYNALRALQLSGVYTS